MCSYQTIVDECDAFLSNLEAKISPSSVNDENPHFDAKGFQSVTEIASNIFADSIDIDNLNPYDIESVNVSCCRDLLLAISGIRDSLDNNYGKSAVPPELIEADRIITYLAAYACRFELIPRLQEFLRFYLKAGNNCQPGDTFNVRQANFRYFSRAA